MSRERETPITNDFCVSEGLGDAEPEEAFRALLSHARRMERDRAALMEALEPFAAFMEVADAVHPKGSWQIVLRSDTRTNEVIRLTYAQIAKAKAALSAARGDK